MALTVFTCIQFEIMNKCTLKFFLPIDWMVTSYTVIFVFMLWEPSPFIEPPARYIKANCWLTPSHTKSHNSPTDCLQAAIEVGSVYIGIYRLMPSIDRNALLSGQRRTDHFGSDTPNASSRSRFYRPVAKCWLWPILYNVLHCLTSY